MNLLVAEIMVMDCLAPLNIVSKLLDLSSEVNLGKFLIIFDYGFFVYYNLQFFFFLNKTCFAYRYVATDIPSDFLAQIGDINFHLHKVAQYSYFHM